MRVVIGRGRNRRSFDVPINPNERQEMIDEILRIKFGRN